MPRTFVDELRERDLDSLAALLAARPDLCLPRPYDLADLGVRATTSASVHRALDRLNRFQLGVCEALAALPEGCRVSELAGLLDTDPEICRQAVGQLRDLALIWGPDEEIRLVRAARAAFDPWPGGLAAGSENPLEVAAIDAALADLPAAATRVLEKLAWGPPTGSVRNADRPLPADPSTPVEVLLARGLLRPAGPDTVILPREVALRLRGGFLPPGVAARPEPLVPATRPARVADHAGLGSAFEFVLEVEALVDELARRTPTLLRAGGLAVRDLSALAAATGTDTGRAALGLEIAWAADLIATTSPHACATSAYDVWLGLPVEERWQRLRRAWVESPRWYAASLAQGGHALGNEADARWATEARAEVLATLTPGTTVDLGRIAAAVAWARPGLARIIPAESVAAAVVAEATTLGMIALTTVTGLVADPLPDDLRAGFPEPVRELILQADLTAVAPGPLAHQVTAVLRQLADQESRGGGGVWRFTAGSLRRGFDAGWDAAAIERWLAEHATTSVPQPLTYLIGDVARTHGSIRVGQVAAYVTVSDPAQVEQILHHPEAAALGIRELAPQVLVATADADEVVELLRSLRLSPAAENADGEVVPTPPPRRANAPRRTAQPAAPDPATVAADLLSGAESSRRRATRTEDTLDVLRQAQELGRQVEVDYVDDTGTRVSRTLVPFGMGAGMVRLIGQGATRTVPLARITAARPVDG